MATDMAGVQHKTVGFRVLRRSWCMSCFENHGLWGLLRRFYNWGAPGFKIWRLLHCWKRVAFTVHLSQHRTPKTRYHMYFCVTKISHTFGKSSHTLFASGGPMLKHGFDKFVFWLKCHKLATAFAGLAKFAAPVVLRLHNLKLALFGTQRSLTLQSLHSCYSNTGSGWDLGGFSDWFRVLLWTNCMWFGYLGVKLWPRCRSMFEKTTRALTPPICGSRPAIFQLR